jgi:hypothetical protein
MSARRALRTSCGQLFCGGCPKRIEQRATGVPNCLISLAVFDIPDKQRVQQLVARPAGRLTPFAQHSLDLATRTALGYANGTGVAQNPAEAMRRFRLAADQGFPTAVLTAQLTFGLCYARGIGVAQNDAEAMRWYHLAADQGNAGAQTALAQQKKKKKKKKNV